MKNLLAIFALASSLAITRAQTLTNQPFFSGPLYDALATIGSASNLAVSVYGAYSTDHKDWGAGIAAIYNFNQFVSSAIRLDYIDSTKTLYMPSINAQLQAPIKLGQVELVPFVLGGTGIPLSGAGQKNGEIVGIIGAGAALRFNKHFDIAWTYEHWTNLRSDYIRIGPIWKF